MPSPPPELYMTFPASMPENWRTLAMATAMRSSWVGSVLATLRDLEGSGYTYQEWCRLSSRRALERVTDGR